jgi:hypothetical protein
MNKHRMVIGDLEQILKLMARIETHHGRCFHEVYPDLEESCQTALTEHKAIPFVLNELNKIIDEIN